MNETADLNDSTESLFTLLRGRLFQFRIVRGGKDCCLSCKRVSGIWYEREKVHVPGESNWWHDYVCFGIAASSCDILYSMTRRGSARLCQFRCPIMLPTLKVL